MQNCYLFILEEFTRKTLQLDAKQPGIIKSLIYNTRMVTGCTELKTVKKSLPQPTLWLCILQAKGKPVITWEKEQEPQNILSSCFGHIISMSKEDFLQLVNAVFCSKKKKKKKIKMSMAGSIWKQHNKQQRFEVLLQDNLNS